jgi:DNA-binding response OmpR family regulator
MASESGKLIGDLRSERLPSQVYNSRIARFGAYEVDLTAGQLRKSGVRIKLQDRPFQILSVLLERPGEIVTREELEKRPSPSSARLFPMRRTIPVLSRHFRAAAIALSLPSPSAEMGLPSNKRGP